MEIYLVRHTETICEKSICYGQTDVAIREPYIETFREIKNQIPSNAIVYSSPLSRCYQLATFLSDTVVKDDRLMEMNFGDWEMNSWDTIPFEEISTWMNDFVTVSTPNGESFVALHDRVCQFLEHLSSPKNTPIVIVSHAGVIRSILCKINQLDLKDAFLNKVDFGMVIKLRFN